MRAVVRPCRELPGLEVEEATDDTAEFYAVYVEQPDGKYLWQSDHLTKTDAEYSASRIM